MFLFSWNILLFLCLLSAKFYQKVTLLNLLEEWTLTNLILINRQNNLIKLINLILLLLLLLQSFFLSFLFFFLLFFQFSFLFFQSSILLFLFDFVLFFFVLSISSIFFFLPFNNLRLHISHPLDIFNHKLLLGVINQGTIISIFEFISLLPNLVLLISIFVPFFIYFFDLLVKLLSACLLNIYVFL